ncbi:MAG: hypothetical protein AAF772_08300 [Acidobacteriota bacterium]
MSVFDVVSNDRQSIGGSGDGSFSVSDVLSPSSSSPGSTSTSTSSSTFNINDVFANKVDVTAWRNDPIFAGNDYSSGGSGGDDGAVRYRPRMWKAETDNEFTGLKDQIAGLQEGAQPQTVGTDRHVALGREMSEMVDTLRDIKDSPFATADQRGEAEVLLDALVKVGHPTQNRELFDFIEGRTESLSSATEPSTGNIDSLFSAVPDVVDSSEYRSLSWFNRESKTRENLSDLADDTELPANIRSAAKKLLDKLTEIGTASASAGRFELIEAMSKELGQMATDIRKATEG